MATQVEIDRALAAVTATLNDQKLEHFEAGRVQEIVTEALGGEPQLTVDDGGGLHNEAGARVGAIRKASSGDWIAERQNEQAERSETAVPTEPSDSSAQGILSKLKRLMS